MGNRVIPRISPILILLGAQITADIVLQFFVAACRQPLNNFETCAVIKSKHNFVSISQKCAVATTLQIILVFSRPT
jgi:hypothetical protein